MDKYRFNMPAHGGSALESGSGQWRMFRNTNPRHYKKARPRFLMVQKGEGRCPCFFGRARKWMRWKAAAIVAGETGARGCSL
jgi:hypothetical protein